MPNVHLYKCDNPECDRMGSPVECRYKGKFPKGWIRVNVVIHPDTVEGAAGHQAYCSLACFRTMLVEFDFYDDFRTEHDESAREDATVGASTEGDHQTQ